MTNPLENLDNMDQTPSQTDRRRAPERRGAPSQGGKAGDSGKHPQEEGLGDADGLDPDKTGDIADEGTGRRG